VDGEGMLRCINPIYWLLWIFIASVLPAQAAEQNNNDWLESGWEQLELEHSQQALRLWQQGVNTQLDSRLFAVLGVYQLRDNALNKLHQIGQIHQTFIIHDTQSDPQRYFVLSARDVAPDRALRQQQLADLKLAANIADTLLARSAKTFKNDVLPDDSTQLLIDPASAIPPLWLTQGWEKIDIYDIDHALQIWQIGLNSLQNERLLVSLGVFAKQENAVAKIKQIGREQLVFIAIRRIGKPLYYVLSMREVAANPVIRQTYLAELKQAANITSKLLATASINFKNRLILEHYPDTFSSSSLHIANHESNPEKTELPVTGQSGATTPDQPAISRFEISGNQQVSTDTIILELSDFFDMENSPANRTLIKHRIADLYHDTGLNHVSITIPEEVLGGTVSIVILEDHL